MTEHLRRYLDLEAKLSRWRAEHPRFTSEEAALLDEIDTLWGKLSHDELRWLDGYLSKKPLAA